MSGAPQHAGQSQAADRFVLPAYRDRSLGDILPAVARALGVEAGLPDTSIQLPAAPHYVVFLVDGLGYQLLHDHPDDAPFLHAHLGDTAPATVGVPSTTATSLTSLGTALTPGHHGVVGYTSRIPGTEQLLNALAWDSSVDPREWQPNATAFERLAAAGVCTTVVNKRDFESSGLTVASSRGGLFVGADKAGERLAAVLAATGEAPSLTYLYEGDLDWTGHAYGVSSLQWRLELGMVDAAVEQLREALPSDVRLVVVADHGMVDSPAEHRIDLEEHPQLRDGVALVGGEARFRHLYCRAGAVDDVVDSWRAALGGRAEILRRDEAVSEGWFGDVVAGVRPRLGDVLVAARADFAVLDTATFPVEAKLVGMHGSLTAAEMLVPVVVC